MKCNACKHWFNASTSCTKTQTALPCTPSLFAKDSVSAESKYQYVPPVIYTVYRISNIWRSSMFKLVQTFKKSESQESRTHINVPPLHICQASHVKQTPGSVRQFVKIKHKQVKLTQ